MGHCSLVKHKKSNHTDYSTAKAGDTVHPMPLSNSILLTFLMYNLSLIIHWFSVYTWALKKKKSPSLFVLADTSVLLWKGGILGMGKARVWKKKSQTKKTTTTTPKIHT